jgi:hypothetical protein
MKSNGVKEAGAACALARAAREGLPFEKVPGGYSLLLDQLFALNVWVLIPRTPEARGDAARRLLGAEAKGEPVPFFFPGIEQDVYAFDDGDECFIPCCGQNAHVEIRGWGAVTLPAKTFEDGVLRALAGSSVTRALDARRHYGLEPYLARWTEGDGWIDQEL